MNNKGLAAAAGISLIAAAGLASALIITMSRHNTPVPEYVFEDSSAYTAAASVETTPQPEAESAAPETRHSVVLSRDPHNFAKLSFDDYTIHVTGRFDEEISAVKLASENIFAELITVGSAFSAELTIPENICGYDYLYIIMKSGALQKYRIHIVDEQISVVGAHMAEKNSAVLEKPTEISPEICAMYISDDADETEIREALDEIKRLSDEICDGIQSDYDKLRALSRWVSENIYYDFEARNTSITVETISLCRVLKLHRTVCGGFANLFAALCEAQGIKCYNVRGAVVTNGSFEENSDTSASHEWTAAEIDGRLVWVDTVGNTTNSFTKGEYTKGVTHMKFFDIENLPLGADHRAERCEYRSYFGCLSVFENTQPQ